MNAREFYGGSLRVTTGANFTASPLHARMLVVDPSANITITLPDPPAIIRPGRLALAIFTLETGSNVITVQNHLTTTLMSIPAFKVGLFSLDAAGAWIGLRFDREA